MDTDKQGTIEYISVVDRSWRRMVSILFRPFELGKWFALGFTAWLATLLQSSGINFNYTSSGGEQAPNMDHVSNQVSAFLKEYGTILIFAGIAVAILIFVITIVLAWVQARGHFMFLDNVIRNRSLIAKPWKSFKRQGNSLFLWNLAFGIIVFFALAVTAAVGYFSLAPYISSKANPILAIAGTGLSAFMLFAIILITSYIGCFANDFVTPIMRIEKCRILQAWSSFLTLFREKPGPFLLWGLFKLGVLVIVNIAVIALVFATCCIAGCLLAIPYIGTVLFLPVLVFYRALGPEFLSQFGDAFRLPPPITDNPHNESAGTENQIGEPIS